MSIFKTAIAISLTSLLLASGCNSSQFPVRMAKGLVTCDGKPVTSGSISFTPIGVSGELETGKPASAVIGSDGTFVLSTYGRFDGAIVGKHRVQFEGASEDEDSEAETTDEEETSSKNKNRKKTSNTSACVQKEEILVEVLANGQNNFTIELRSQAK